jgi:NitT/TauT family transport system permease protein
VKLSALALTCLPVAAPRAGGGTSSSTALVADAAQGRCGVDAGVQNTDPDLLEAARSFGASRGQIFRHILLPGALPYIVTGLRSGAATGMVGTVIAELQTSLAGLGFLTAQFSGSFQIAKYFPPVIVLALLGMLISQALKVLERRLARWKTSREVSV